MSSAANYTVFDGSKMLYQGPLTTVVQKIKKRMGQSSNSSFLIFNDETGKTIDFNFHGSEDDVQKRLSVFVGAEGGTEQVSGPGRPKLGVVSREISLLPRHWEWLAAQPSGASATLRQLVESAMKKSASNTTLKQAQERTYRFISVMAGDLEGYEEALRALYKKEKKTFVAQMRNWPDDVKDHAIALSRDAFDT